MAVRRDRVAGGVATSGLEMSQNAMRLSWPREEVDARLLEIMKAILKAPVDLLWLNHNWHLTHHENPSVPWIHLPSKSVGAETHRGFLLTAYLKMWRGPRRANERVQNRYAGKLIP